MMGKILANVLITLDFSGGWGKTVTEIRLRLHFEAEAMDCSAPAIGGCHLATLVSAAKVSPGAFASAMALTPAGPWLAEQSEFWRDRVWRAFTAWPTGAAEPLGWSG